MKILGIDPSLTGTGLCIFDPDTEEFKTLILKSKHKEADRLIDLRNQFGDFLNDNEITMAFMEGYAFGARGNTFSIGEWGGLIKTQLKDHDILTFIVTPSTLKKFVAGNGNAKKELMREWCYRKFGQGSEVLKTNDEVDAYCLCQFGKFYGRIMEGDPDLLKKDLEIVKKKGTVIKL